MRWIRWDGNGSFDFQRDKPDEGSEDWDQYLAEEYVDCEKHDDWREIESGTLNLEDGKLHITLKPLPTPEKVLTLVEAAKNYLKTAWQIYRSDELRGLQSLGYGTSIFNHAIQLAEAIEREEKKPANPYTKEAVDELLDSLKEAGYEFTKRDSCSPQMSRNGYMWIHNAYQSLCDQREAANVQ